jgi:uncharacterized phage-associated protein
MFMVCSDVVDARIIANAVLDRAEVSARPLTNLDLQKIVYFLHGHFLLRHGRPLVEPEFEAWSYGPVHRTLYDAFKSYDDTSIEDRADAFDPIRRERKVLPEPSDIEALAIIDEFLPRYLDTPTYLLVSMTHQIGTPWHETIERAKEHLNVGMKISDALIMERFEGMKWPIR